MRLGARARPMTGSATSGLLASFQAVAIKTSRSQISWRLDLNTATLLWRRCRPSHRRTFIAQARMLQVALREQDRDLLVRFVGKK